MTTVYLLSHERDVDGAGDIKLIGIYPSEEEAERARERTASLPGFRDFRDGFSIDPYPLGKDHWTGGFEVVTAPRASQVA